MVCLFIIYYIESYNTDIGHPYHHNKVVFFCNFILLCAKLNVHMILTTVYQINFKF